MAKIRKAPDWKQFEEAVAAFAKALDPEASIQHNVLEPDRHTSRPRQRDVLIDARVCKMFPVRVLVSCKRYRRRLHQQDIDAFVGELGSSDAHKGVIYSYSGFAGSALEKARALGICCCRLYLDEPAELPPSIELDAFCMNTSVYLEATGLGGCSPYWRDLLDVPTKEF